MKYFEPRKSNSNTKTYHLNRGHMFLPEQVLAHMGSDCRQSIINIHQYMDETIDEGKECTVTSCRENKDSVQLELIIPLFIS